MSRSCVQTPTQKFDSQLSGLSVDATRSSIGGLRRLAVLYMQTHPDAFQHAPKGRESDTSFEEYLGGNGKAALPGDDNTLLALASALGIAIHVVAEHGKSTPLRRLRVSHRLIKPLGGQATHTIFLHEWSHRKKTYYEGLAAVSSAGLVFLHEWSYRKRVYYESQQADSEASAADVSAANTISTDQDHESLIRKVSQILGITCESAAFLLEASSWNVELALNNSFGTVESSKAYRNPPEQAELAPAENAKEDDTASQSSDAFSKASTKSIAASKSSNPSSETKRVAHESVHESRQCTEEDSTNYPLIIKADPGFAPVAPTLAAHPSSMPQRPMAAAERSSMPCLACVRS